MLFSLSLLVDISWLSGDNDLQTISQVMAWGIFIVTAVISFFYLQEFRPLHFPHRRGSPSPSSSASASTYLSATETDTERYPFSTAHLFQSGQLRQGRLAAGPCGQRARRCAFRRTGVVDAKYAWAMFTLAAVAVGLLFTSKLNCRLVAGVFIVGWLGLMPYAYEPFASATHPPMNWGVRPPRAPASTIRSAASNTRRACPS